ncbi:MAG: YdcF family protein [Aquificaceae bacterium]
MFLIKKILSNLLLPPGLFILALLTIAFLERRKKATYYISIMSAILLYFLSIEPIKDALLTPLENKYPVPKRFSADVIVVLGGGSYGSGVLKEDSMKRLLTGTLLHKETGLPIILSGGANLLPDADIMKSFLLSLGVDRKSIITEVESRDTKENSLFVKKICEERGYRRIVLVTSAYHMPRAVLSFKKEGMDVIPYPTDFKRDIRYNLFSFLPKMGVLDDSIKALREYLGTLVYEYAD